MPSRHNSLSKVVSVLLCLFLLGGDVALCAEQVGLGGAPVAVATSGDIAFRAPLEHAVVKEFYKGTNGKLVIHIQDAHANPGAQRHLAGALEALMRERAIDLVLVEGASVDVSLGDIRKEYDPAVIERVASRFLKEGKIAGEEYLNLTSDLPMRLVGVEDRALYGEAVAAYKDLALRRSEALLYARKLRIAVERLKSIHYPRELLRYEHVKMASGDRFSKLLSALVKIGREAGVALESYPLTTRFAAMGSDSSKTVGFTAEDAAKLIAETEALEQDAYNLLLDSGLLRRLRAVDRHVGLLEDAYSIAITSARFEMLRRAGEGWDTVRLVAFLNGLLVDAGAGDAVVSYDPVLQNARPALDLFYDLTARRDEAFVRNAVGAMKGEEVAVLIAGGYHTRHLMDLLQAQGYSTAVLSPYVDEATDYADYEKILLEPSGASTLRSAAIAEPEFLPGGVTNERIRMRGLRGALVIASRGAKKEGAYPHGSRLAFLNMADEALREEFVHKRTELLRSIHSVLMLPRDTVASELRASSELGSAILKIILSENDKTARNIAVSIVLLMNYEVRRIVINSLMDALPQSHRKIRTAEAIAKLGVVSGDEKTVRMVLYLIVIHAGREVFYGEGEDGIDFFWNAVKGLNSDQKSVLVRDLFAEYEFSIDQTGEYVASEGFYVRSHVVGDMFRRGHLKVSDLRVAFEKVSSAAKPAMIHFFAPALNELRMSSYKDRVEFEDDLLTGIQGSGPSVYLRGGQVKFRQRQVRVFSARMRMLPVGVKHPVAGIGDDAQNLALLPDSSTAPQWVVSESQELLDSLAFMRFYVRDVEGKRSMVISTQQSPAYPIAVKNNNEDWRRALSDWPWVLRMAAEYVARNYPPDEHGRSIEQIVSPTAQTVGEMWSDASIDFLKMVYETDIKQFGYQKEFFEKIIPVDLGVETDAAYVKKLSPQDSEAALLQSLFSGARTVVQPIGDNKSIELFGTDPNAILDLESMRADAIVVPANNLFFRENHLPRWGNTESVWKYQNLLYGRIPSKEYNVGDVDVVNFEGSYPRIAIHSVNRYVAGTGVVSASVHVHPSNVEKAVWAALQEAERLGIERVVITDAIAGTNPKERDIRSIASTSARFLNQPNTSLRHVLIGVNSEEVFEKSTAGIAEIVAKPVVASVFQFQKNGVGGWDVIEEMTLKDDNRNSSSDFYELIKALSGIRSQAIAEKWPSVWLFESAEALVQYYRKGLSSQERELIDYALTSIGGLTLRDGIDIDGLMNERLRQTQQLTEALPKTMGLASWLSGSENVKVRILAKHKYSNTYELHVFPHWNESERARFEGILRASKGNYPGLMQGSIGRVMADITYVSGEMSVVFTENQTTEGSHNLPIEIFRRFQTQWIRAAQDYFISIAANQDTRQAYALSASSVKELYGYDSEDIRQERRVYYQPYADWEKARPRLTVYTGELKILEMYRRPQERATRPPEAYSDFGPQFEGFSDFVPAVAGGAQEKPVSRVASAMVRFDKPVDPALLRAVLHYGDPDRKIKWQDLVVNTVEVGGGAYRLEYRIPKGAHSYTLRVSADGGVTWAWQGWNIRVVSGARSGAGDGVRAADEGLLQMADTLSDDTGTQSILARAAAKIVGSRVPERLRIPFATERGTAVWAERRGGAVEFSGNTGSAARIVPEQGEVDAARLGWAKRKSAASDTRTVAFATVFDAQAAEKNIADRLASEKAMLVSDTHFVLLKYSADSFLVTHYGAVLEALQARWAREGVQAAIEIDLETDFAAGTELGKNSDRIRSQNTEARRALERERQVGREVLIVDLRDPDALDAPIFEKLTRAGHSVLAMERAKISDSDGIPYIDIVELSYDLVYSARQAAEARLPNSRMLRRLGASAEEGLLILTGKADRSLVLRNPLSWTLRINLDELLLVAQRAIQMLETSK